MITTPLRTSWEISAKDIFTKPYVIFGWKVYQHIMPVGSSLAVYSEQEIPRHLVTDISMYVRGKASTKTVQSTGTVEHPNRVPGIYSPERIAHPAGTTTITALEETEFWCFNWVANRKSLPNLIPIRVKALESLSIPIGSNILIVTGESNINTGSVYFTSAENITLIAETDVYGFIIESER